MFELTQLQVARAWLSARWELARNDEDGASAVEWLLIIVGVVGLAALAIAAVRTFITEQATKLNGG